MNKAKVGPNKKNIDDGDYVLVNPNKRSPQNGDYILSPEERERESKHTN